MSTFARTLPGIILASAALIGCGPSGSAGEPAGSSQARIVVTAQDSALASVQITATLDETGEVAIVRSVDASADHPATFDVDLAPGSYTIHVHVFADGSHAKLIGMGKGHATLAAGGVTDIGLHTGKGRVEVKADQAPIIEDVNVSATADGGLRIHVDATDAEGQALTFYWSGLGVQGAVSGSSTFALSSEALARADGPAVVRIVVQDSGGATAAAQVVVTPNGGSSVTSVGAEESVDARACVDARVSCSARCDATLLADPLALASHASCQAACALSFATCAMP